MATGIISKIKHIDKSITISSGDQYESGGLGFSRERVVGLAPIYNDNFYFQPIVASLRTTVDNITIVIASGTTATTNRTYVVRVWYI